MEEFIKYFGEQFEETDTSKFTADTKFHLLGEWESLIGMAVLNMIAQKYGVRLQPKDIRESITIGDIYAIVQSKLAAK